jgi:hypothetical protein
VGVVDPGGQANPGEQGPLHDALIKAGLAPYRPPGHRPEHVEVVMVVAEPYTPGGQGLQATAPTSLYWPAGHTGRVPLAEPSGQKYPAGQGPAQEGVVMDTSPYLPAAAKDTGHRSGQALHNVNWASCRVCFLCACVPVTSTRR